MSRSKNFRPHLECLEDRSLLDAGFGHTLLPVPRTVPTLAASAAPRGELSADAYFVEQQARAILKNKIIGNDATHGKLSNPWALGNSLLVWGPSVFNETGNKIEVSYRLQYGSPTRECTVWMVLEGHMKGGDKVYTLKAAGLHGWESQWFNFWVSPNGFGDYARARFEGIHLHRFDTGRFVQNVLRQAETILGAPDRSFRADEVTPINGGLGVIIYLGQGQSVARFPYIKLRFNYTEADVKDGWVRVSTAENGEMHFSGDHFNFYTRREYPDAHPLRVARWQLP